MRIAIVGQQKFGQSALEAFLARGDEVAAVFTAPDKPGAPPDPLHVAAQKLGLTTHQFATLKSTDAQQALRDLAVDLGVMAYVLQFVPQEFACIPRHGMIQYHPSLLPRHRGPSSINWPIICGERETGLTIFRPTDGLDEGPVILQKKTPIGPDDTLGSVYFDRLFPLGIAALLEAADLVVAGRASAVIQDESQASYEGWCRAEEARVNWHSHVDLVYNLVRGCDPAPGAWTTFKDKRLQLFEARKHTVRTFSGVLGPIGSVAAIGAGSFSVTAQGGLIEIAKVRYDGGKKMAAAQFCTDVGIAAGGAVLT